MNRRILRSVLAVCAAAAMLGAGAATAATIRIPRGTEPRPVRLAAGDQVGRMVFARHYRPTLEDAIPERVTLFQEGKLLAMEDWLREWGSVQIRQIGRPF